MGKTEKMVLVDKQSGIFRFLGKTVLARYPKESADIFVETLEKIDFVFVKITGTDKYAGQYALFRSEDVRGHRKPFLAGKRKQEKIRGVHPKWRVDLKDLSVVLESGSPDFRPLCKKLAVFNNVKEMRAAVEEWAIAGCALEPDDAPREDDGAAADGEGGGRSGANVSDNSNPGDSIYFEGNPKLAVHYRRERSRKLRDDKIKSVEKLACELCGDEGAGYPADCRGRLFEVHHKLPLADAENEVETSLDDLAVVCANCHRAVHVDANVEKNFHELKAHFESQE